MLPPPPGRVGEQPHRRPCTIDLRPRITLGLRPAPRLLEDLEGRLIAIDQVRLQQRIAQQVDQRLHGLARAHHAGCERGA